MPRLRRKQSQKPEYPASAIAPDALLDVAGAAKWIGVGRTKLFELMQEEDFPVIRIGERVVRFDPNSLYQWALTRQKNGSPL